MDPRELRRLQQMIRLVKQLKQLKETLQRLDTARRNEAFEEWLKEHREELRGFGFEPEVLLRETCDYDSAAWEKILRELEGR